MVELSVAMILGAGIGGLLSATAAANTSVALFGASIVLYSGFMPGVYPALFPGHSHLLWVLLHCVAPLARCSHAKVVCTSVHALYTGLRMRSEALGL